MKVFNNRYMKSIFLFSLVIIILNCIIVYFISNIALNSYTNKVNENIANIVGNIKTNYPNISEEEIVDILNNNTNYNSGKNILRDYGIDLETPAIFSLKHQGNIVVFLNILICLCSSSILIILFICYLKYREKKIDKLVEYLEELSNRNYTLDIEENTEDELSKLKSKLYKIAVLLKEEASISTTRREEMLVFLSDISHQLKTPLTSSMILLDNLNESNNMDEVTKSKFINEISRQIESMNFLITSLLKLSKLDANAVIFIKNKVNIKEIILEIVHELEIIAELKNVTVKIDGEDSILKIDYNWNKEAIKNVIKNAIEHTKKNTTVKVKIYDNNVYTQISVFDEGEGISRKDIKHIFDRFYKSKNSSESSFGIGLSLAKSVIEKQGGYITVNSKLGSGSEFIIKYLK